MGACAIEKHLTLARADGGHDSEFSMEPNELGELVEGVRTAWEALGRAHYEREPSEAANALFRRSLYVVEDIASGDTFTRRNVRSIRPGKGLPPKHLSLILGKRATRTLRRGTPLDWSAIEP